MPELRSPAPDLWERYRHAPKGGQAEDELIQQYLPLVKTVVGRVAMSLPSHIRMDDLYGAGLVGLLHAVRQFDRSAGRARHERHVFRRGQRRQPAPLPVAF